jgi:hypothetical protein
MRKNRVFVLQQEFLWDTYGSFLSSLEPTMILDAAGGKTSFLVAEKCGRLGICCSGPGCTEESSGKSNPNTYGPIPKRISAPFPNSAYQPLAKLIPKLEEKDSFARALRI